MKKTVLLLIIVSVIIGCKKSRKFYYPNGKLHVEYFTDKSGGIIGNHKEFFENGKLKILQKYNNDNVAYEIDGYYDTGELKFKQFKSAKLDSFFCYHKMGKIESRGIIKNNRRFGWWSFYSLKGKLDSKIDYKFINDTLRENQVKRFVKGEKLDLKNSYFYKNNIPTKIEIGSTIDVFFKYISKYSASSIIYLCYSKDLNSNFDNLSKIKLDTLYPNPKATKGEFRINLAFSKVDTINFRGFLKEKINLFETIDSSMVKVKKYSNTIYFDKKIIVTPDATSMSSQE